MKGFTLTVGEIMSASAVICAAIIALFGVWYGYKKEKELERLRSRPIPDSIKPFLSKDEVLLSYDLESGDFRSTLAKTKKSAKVITLTGAAWMLNPKVINSIKKAVRRGVKVSLLLQNPYCDEAKEERDLEFSTSTVPDPGVPKRPSEYLVENVKRTLEEYIPIIGEDKIRIVDGIIVIKGTMFDSKIAHILSYAIPKRGTPIRLITNPKTVAYIDKYYFDEMYEKATPVYKKLKKWKEINGEFWEDLN